MDRKKAGQNLTEFGILLALVSLVLILAYSLLGQNIVEMFSLSKKEVHDFQPFGVGYDSEGGFRTYKAGELGGSPGTPASSCTGDRCTIDYGTFVLNGIPADFGEFVETSGTAGGTNQLASLMEQIAQQLEEAGDTTAANEFIRLADLGHYLADHQKMVEGFANECQSDPDPGMCLSTKTTSATPPQVPDSLDPYFDGSFDAYNNLYNRIYDLPSYASYNLAHGGTALPTGRLSYAMLDAYNDLKTDSATNPNITPEMVAITEQLFRQMDTMATNMYANLRNANGSPTTVPQFDLITGVQTGDVPAPASLTMDDFIHPQTSIGTDLKSTLICAVGGPGC